MVNVREIRDEQQVVALLNSLQVRALRFILIVWCGGVVIRSIICL